MAMFHGIVRQIPSRIPEVILSIPVYVGKEELARRWQTSAPGKFEHRNMTFYGFDELPGFLEEHGASMVPSGCATISSFTETYKPARKRLELLKTS